jgi:hypothetical protein
MKKPSLRRFDAEVTLFGSFMILLCVFNYFMPFWGFFIPSTILTVLIAQFTSLFTLFILGTVGVALACMVKPVRLRNVLWLPFMYAYWGFQSFIAMYALFEIVLRRKRQWRKTEHSGQVTGMSEKLLWHKPKVPLKDGLRVLLTEGVLPVSEVFSKVGKVEA